MPADSNASGLRSRVWGILARWEGGCLWSPAGLGSTSRAILDMWPWAGFLPSLSSEGEKMIVPISRGEVGKATEDHVYQAPKQGPPAQRLQEVPDRRRPKKLNKQTNKNETTYGG